MNFTLYLFNIPENFVKIKFKINEQRHIIFATEQQLELLAKGEFFLSDATFKSVKKTFHQLASLHSLNKSDGSMTQVLLVFISLSWRRSSDNNAVIAAIINMLPTKLAVKEVVLYF